MLTERQKSIFNTFLQCPEEKKTASDFTELDVERTSLFRDLRKLVQLQLLVQDGKGYRVSKDSDGYIKWDLSRPPFQRNPVSYNPLLLGGYKPNVSFLLDDAQMKSLEKVGSVSGVKEASGQGKSYERVLSSLLIDLTHASSNLENVNISWLDTKTLIEFGEKPDGFSEKQMRVVLNHKEAIAFLMLHGKDMSIVKKDLMDIHSILMGGLLGDVSATGNLRSAVVRFDDSKYTPPSNQDQLRESFQEFCEKASAINNPYEQSFFTMVFIPYMQPFQDGNKRTSRIAMNIPLVKNELAPFSFSDIGKRDYIFGLLAFYERGRHSFLAESFVGAYERSAVRYSSLVNFINEGGLLNTITEKKDYASPEKVMAARKSDSPGM